MSARKSRKVSPWQATKRNETLTSDTLTTIQSMNITTRSSSIGVSKKSKKSSSASSGALKKSKTSSQSTGSSTKSKNPSETDIFESSDKDSDDWLTINAELISSEKSKLISEKSMIENSEYSIKSPERIREALIPIPDIYNPNESILRIDENVGISKSTKSTTILKSTKIVSPEAPIVAEQASDLEDLSDTSSGSLHVLHEENRKTYFAPTEDPTWNKRWYDTRKKISPKRQKFQKKWTLEAIFGKKRWIHPKPEEIKFHEADLRAANKLWDNFKTKESANSTASCSTISKRKFFKKNAIHNNSKREKNDENESFSRNVSPCPPGMTCVRRKLIDTDSDSDSLTFSEWRMVKRLRNKHQNTDDDTVDSTRRRQKNSSEES